VTLFAVNGGARTLAKGGEVKGVAYSLWFVRIRTERTQFPAIENCQGGRTTLESRIETVAGILSGCPH
jgi:hypothetical protein